MKKEYRCILCALRQLLLQIPMQVKYFGLMNIGSFQFPHVIDERHHKLTKKVWVPEWRIKTLKWELKNNEHKTITERLWSLWRSTWNNTLWPNKAWTKDSRKTNRSKSSCRHLCNNLWRTSDIHLHVHEWWIHYAKVG